MMSWYRCTRCNVWLFSDRGMCIPCAAIEAASASGVAALKLIDDTLAYEWLRDAAIHGRTRLERDQIYLVYERYVTP